METRPVVIGLSSDNRTNRWRITCPKCGTVFEPGTTRMGKQLLDCPKMKCGGEMVADYNSEPPVVRLTSSSTST